MARTPSPAASANTILLAAAASCWLITGCTTVSTVTPPEPSTRPAWTIERQVLDCRVSETGISRTASAGAGGLFIFGTIATVSRPAAEDCATILALTDQDIAEIRTLIQATAASGRGLATHWTTLDGRRREIALSVYPDGQHAGLPCRSVTASLTLRDSPSAARAATLAEQRLCQRPAGDWQPP
jgi:hypothetical protein